MNETPIIEKYLRARYYTIEPSLSADNFEASLYVRDWKTDLNKTVFDGQGKILNTIRNHVYNPTIYGGHLTASKSFTNNTTTYGSDFYYDDRNASFQSKNGVPFAKNSRDTTMLDVGIFINDNWQVNEQWILDGTLRGDFIRYHISEPEYAESPVLTNAFKRNTRLSHLVLTGSVGTIYKFTPDLQTFLNLNRGFRAPTASSLVSSEDNGSSVTLPAPDLKPESNINTEIGVRYFGSRNHLSLSIYQSNYTNLIAIEQISPTVKKRENINKAVVRGVEFEGKTYWTEKLISKYSLAYSQAKDQNTDVSLGFIAPLKGSLSLKYDAYNWYVESVMTIYSHKSFINPKKERETAGYALFDLYAGIPLDTLFASGYADWKLTAGIENIFNKAARNPTINEDINPKYSRELIGNPLYNPGRAFVIQLSGTY